MGVHYLYTWITKRYPLIRREYDREVIPQIDHLYLDMNGVMYLCARDTSAVFKDSLSGKKMEEIFIEIVNYLNYIINTIQPKKTLTISIDGVSPRCKIQNQRIRRFLSSMKQKSFNEFLEKNLKIPASAINFKNNSITPGTDFMSELIEQLHFFIKRKFLEDPAWKNLKVKFSGGDVPGEGEHKILEHIRQWKTSPEFDPNDSHCIYGGDSDLVLLGLMTHLPNIIILRESFPKMIKKTISSATKRHSDPPKFEVIVLSILRDYLSLEYLGDPEEPPLNLERVIDDFIFFTYLIGNDFLHQLFCMNVKQGNFDRCLTVLQEHYKKKGQHLVSGIDINYEAFRDILKKLVPIEKQMVQSTLEDFRQAERELKKSKLFRLLPEDKKKLEQINRDTEKSTTASELLEGFKKKIKEKQKDVDLEKIESTSVPSEFPTPTQDEMPRIEKTNRKLSTYSEEFAPNQEELNSTTMKDINKSDESSSANQQDESSSEQETDDLLINDVYLAEFWDNFKKIKQAKENLEKILGMIEKKEDIRDFYYKEYLDSKNDVEAFLPNICNSYLKGLNFVFQYYKIGCPSWTWFYKYPQAPLIRDILNYITAMLNNKQQIKFEFQMNEPAPPFVQLIYVLPVHSLNLLPQVLAEAVVAENSPLKKYFPEKYDFRPTDQVKDYTWEPVIKFIDEADMKKFMETFEWSQIEDIKERNRVGSEWVYQIDPNSSMQVKSVLQGFEDFSVSLSATPMPRKPRLTAKDVDDHSYLKQLKPDVFPTLFIYKDMKLRKIEFRKRDTMHILLTNETLKQLYKQFMEDFSQYYKEQTNQEINVYFGNIYRKCYRLNRVFKMNKSNPDYKRFCRTIQDYFSDNYFLFPDNLDISSIIDTIPIVSVSEPIFSHITKNVFKKQPKIMIHKENSGILIPFCSVWLKRGYPSLKMNTDKFLQSSFDHSILLSLMSGSLYETGNLIKNEIKLLRFNSLVENLKIKNDNSSFSQLEWSFIEEIGLNKEQIMIFWIVLDSLRIDCDSDLSSTAMLGDTFDVGLNFIHFLNKRVYSWTVVSDLIKINLYSGRSPNPKYCYILDEKGKFYEVFVSQEAADSIRAYFKECWQIIEYLKSINNNLRKNTPKGPIIRTSFSVRSVFPQEIEKGLDVNIILFNLYAKIMRQDHSTRSLHHSLSIYYTRETIQSKLTNFRQNTEADEKFDPSPYDTVADTKFDDCLWPALNRKPDYHRIGDRVVTLTSHNKNAKFGQIGTIIGVYKESVEVIFDTPFIGANDLCGRVPKFRGQILKFFDLFNLSSWSKDIVHKESNFNNVWDGHFDLSNFLEQLKKESTNLRK